MTQQDEQTHIQGKLQCHVLIIGAGLAGLAAAICIRGAGHQVTIIERMPELREIGAGIQLAPNATILLKNWGILEAVQSQAFQPEKTFIRPCKGGNALATQEHGLVLAEQYSAPYLLLHRADIQRILREKAESLGAQLVLNASLASISLDTAKPSVRLQSGQLYEADVILGADGERSVCREKLLGREDPLGSTGNLVYRFTVLANEVQHHDDLIDLVDPKNINLWLGPGSHAVSYVVKHDGLLNVTLTVPQDPLDKVQYGVQRVAIQELREVFEIWDVRLGALLDLAQGCSKWSLLQSNEIETWTHPSGRFALLGDSAHAMIPSLAQGASQCFEDAAALGTLFSLIERRAQLDDILLIYERLRKPRAMEVRRRSGKELRIFCLPNGPEQQDRDDQLSSQLRPSKGYPISLMEPIFQKWLWGYNANDEAVKSWGEYQKGFESYNGGSFDSDIYKVLG